MAPERNPWVTSRATGALPTPHSPCPPPAPAAVPSFSSHFQYGHLTGPTCGFCPPPEETGPLHDNYQLEICKQLWTMGQTIFPGTQPRETHSTTPWGSYQPTPNKVGSCCICRPRGKTTPSLPVINNKANSREAEPEGRPFKNFSSGTCSGNKVLPCFHLSNLRLPYGILILSSKLSGCLSKGIIGDKKEKMK